MGRSAHARPTITRGSPDRRGPPGPRGPQRSPARAESRAPRVRDTVAGGEAAELRRAQARWQRLLR
jgi:hypothetical protein